MISEIFRPGGTELTEKAADIMGLKAGDRVLDIGCGFGLSLEILKNKYSIEAFGVDISEEAVLRTNALLGNGTAIKADARRLPFEDGCFDAVFMECVLSLTQNPGLALAEAVRVMKEGAWLVISGLSGGTELLEGGRHNRDKLVEKLEELGLELVQAYDESAALRSFVAGIIFEYDSIENYIRAANEKLGGTVLSCELPLKDTGYMLLLARK